MKQTLLSFLFALLPIVASADAVEIDGIYYNLIPKGKVAEVTNGPNEYSGEVVIPETFVYENVDYNVTKIGDYTFAENYNITSITISKTITTIGEGAFLYFSDNNNFQRINITDLDAWCRIKYEGEMYVTYPLTIANHLYLNGEEIIDLVIPNTVEVIPSFAFSGGRFFKSVSIPSSVTRIEDYAFSDCSSLTSVIIPNSVTSIGNCGFGGCSKLTSVTIPNSVTSIGNNAFEGCSSLTSITIPNSVTSIGDFTFSGCRSLTSLTIPNSVTSIGNYTFYGCSSLTSLNIPNSVISIGSCTFEGCSSLTSLTIPNSVISIGNDTFFQCGNVATITIYGNPSGGDYTFAYCPEITDFYCYSDIVPSAGDNFFYNSYVEYATLHVPESAIESYRNTVPWSSFGTIKALDGTAIHELTICVDNKGTAAYGENSLTDGTQTYYVKEGTDVELTLTADEGYKLASVTVDGIDKTADVVDGVLTISNVTADMTVIVKFATAGETVTATIGSTGMATFCSTSDLDFSEVDGLTAYTGAGFNRETGVLTMLKVTDAPAGTGLVLTGSEGTYEVPVKTSASVYANLLVGVTEETTLSQTDGGYVNYILGNGSHGTGFYIVSGEGQLAAGKAYLRLPAVVAGESRAISITFADDATGIEGISGDSKTTTDDWRDLQGRRIMQPTKAGIYLKDGRKIVVR